MNKLRLSNLREGKEALDGLRLPVIRSKKKDHFGKASVKNTLLGFRKSKLRLLRLDSVRNK